MPSLLIAGCGFLGEAAAGFFCVKNWSVVGLTASAESAARLQDRPFPILAADISSTKSLAAVRARYGAFDFVLHCASSGGGGAEAYEKVYVNGARQLAETFPEARLLFTSSTSVYAQTSGEWVDETSPANPSRETGGLLLKAEAIIQATGGCVLRLAGIYGPGRSVLLRKFVEKSAVLENGGSRWINQIHRDDAVLAVESIARSGAAGMVYNVVDDQPATQSEVYGWIARFLNQPMPPHGPADPNRKRGWTSKRVRNARLRSLGWATRFPNYGFALPSVAASFGVAPPAVGSG